MAAAYPPSTTLHPPAPRGYPDAIMPTLPIKEESIEQGQMDTHDILAHRPSWKMSELADALHVEPSTETRARRTIGEGRNGRTAGDEVTIQDFIQEMQ